MATCLPIPREAPTMRQTGLSEGFILSSEMLLVAPRDEIWRSLGDKI